MSVDGEEIWPSSLERWARASSTQKVSVFVADYRLKIGVLFHLLHAPTAVDIAGRLCISLVADIATACNVHI